MARSYVLANLALNDPSDADWALAYVRFALRDKPNAAGAYPSDSLEDEEINAFLEARKIVDEIVDGGDGTAYYEAHKVAAALLESNPFWAARWSAGSYSEELRNVADIAAALRGAGGWIDQSIISATSRRIGGRSLVLRL